MLGRIRERFPNPPSRETGLLALMTDLAEDLSGLGPLNLLISDGRLLWCRCATNLAWLTRRAPFGAATLLDDDLSADFAAETTPDDIVSVVATRPLTRDEAWTRMSPGDVAVFREGERVG